MNAIALRGIGRLLADGVVGASRIGESLQSTVLDHIPLAFTGVPQAVRVVAGLAHRGVRGVARGAGAGLDTLVDHLAPAHWRGEGGDAERRLRAVANGLFGDHLARSGNPLALPMRLVIDGRRIAAEPAALAAALPRASSRLLVLVHGLCMTPAQWNRGGHDHGAALAAAHGFQPLYVEYNSGLHIVDNGRALADLLQRVHDAWPVAVERLAILAHSMGGLVVRSAIHQAREAGQRWPRTLRDLVFLGTPHQGAPLERAGRTVDRLLQATPWSAPFALPGRSRSAGIGDLRHGDVLGDGTPVPLPRGVRCRAVAGTVPPARSRRARRWVGDGLVPLDSALGHHPDAARALRFADGSRLTVEGAGHFDLLDDPRVARRLVDWLRPEPAGGERDRRRAAPPTRAARRTTAAGAQPERDADSA